MRRVPLIVVVVLGASCAVASETTSEQVTTTEVVAVATTALTAPTLLPPEPLPEGDGASGSGCTPRAVTLPDGVWFGYVSQRSDGAVVFDLACFFFGDVAYEKGAEDGVDVYNDYHVRNLNPVLRTVEVGAGVPVYEIGLETDFVQVPFSDWPLIPTGYIECPSDWCGVWLHVGDGEVIQIVEQYVP